VLLVLTVAFVSFVAATGRDTQQAAERPIGEPELAPAVP
jgi:hypothetical protein